MRFLVAAAGCAALVSCIPAQPVEPAPAVCRDAGFGDSEIAALRPAIRGALDAGAAREEILADAETSCAACEQAENDCVVERCLECFAALVDEISAEEVDTASEGP